MAHPSSSDQPPQHFHFPRRLIRNIWAYASASAASAAFSETIDSNPTAAPQQLLASTLDPSAAEPQLLSPLFSTLPPEIRTRIFEWALRAGPNPDRLYAAGSYYYRPSLTGEPLIATTLLLACRRVYLEIALLLCVENPFRYWWRRPPPGKPASGLPHFDLLRLSPEQLAVSAVQIFIQQFNLEDPHGFQRHVFLNPAFTPSRLVLTLRHGDWWWWEREEALALDARTARRARAGVWRTEEEGFAEGSWGRALGSVVDRAKGLREFVLELETVMKKGGELREIQKVAEGWVFGGLGEGDEEGDGGRLVCDGRLTKEWAWDGIDRFKEQEYMDNRRDCREREYELETEDDEDEDDEDDEDEDEDGEEDEDEDEDEEDDEGLEDGQENEDADEGNEEDGNGRSMDDGTAEGNGSGETVPMPATLTTAATGSVPGSEAVPATDPAPAIPSPLPAPVGPAGPEAKQLKYLVIEMTWKRRYATKR